MCVEMVTVSGRRILLRDEDSSCVTVGKNERRLNTLAHYRVPDGSTLAIVPRYNAATRSNGIQHVTDAFQRQPLFLKSISCA